MSRMLFINFHVTDLPRARAFHQALGFSINEQFSDDSGACVVGSEAV